VDDDNYVNGEGLRALLASFPQDGSFYVGRPSLDRPITAHELLEDNTTVTPHEARAVRGVVWGLSLRVGVGSS
jgi:hypothetical protein